MKNFNINIIYINIIKLLSYLSLILLILSFFNSVFESTLLLDSINEIDTNSNNSNENLIENNTTNIAQNNNLNIYVHLGNYATRTKRWLYWRLSVNRSNRYESYNEFKDAWNSGFSLRKTLKTELQEFKLNSTKYFKENR